MPEANVAPDSNATILYTSGSTAHPKGVLATHRSIIHAVMGWECGAAIAVELNPALAEESPEFPPAMILTVPLFHVSGLNVQFMSSFRPGRKLVGNVQGDPRERWRLIEGGARHRSFNGVPTMLVGNGAVAELPTSTTLCSLKSMGGGGAAMAPARPPSDRQETENQACPAPATA